MQYRNCYSWHAIFFLPLGFLKLILWRNMDRRKFLKISCAGIVAGALPSVAARATELTSLIRPAKWKVTVVRRHVFRICRAVTSMIPKPDIVHWSKEISKASSCLRVICHGHWSAHSVQKHGRRLPRRHSSRFHVARLSVMPFWHRAATLQDLWYSK